MHIGDTATRLRASMPRIRNGDHNNDISDPRKIDFAKLLFKVWTVNVDVSSEH
jgi:hypothetical protein